MTGDNGGKPPQVSSSDNYLRREGFFSRRSNLSASDPFQKDCFVVPPRNDDLLLESVNGSGLVLSDVEVKDF